jgi:hypothetical protein
MHPHSLFISVHRKLSFSCKRRVKDCFRHPARSMDNCWVVSTKVQNALPAQPVLPRLAWRSTAEGDGGFCHSVCGAFSSSRRSRPGRQAKNGDGSTSRRLRPTQILLLFQSLDGGNQGFVATGDDTLQLGTRDGAPQWMFLDVFEDGPAARAGVRPGHHLISVDGTPAILLAFRYFALATNTM